MISDYLNSHMGSCLTVCQNTCIIYMRRALYNPWFTSFSFFKLDPSIFESLQKERVEAGDVIYIEANSGAVKVRPQGEPGGKRPLFMGSGGGRGAGSAAPLWLVKLAFPLSAFFNLLMTKTDSLLEKHCNLFGRGEQ